MMPLWQDRVATRDHDPRGRRCVTQFLFYTAVGACAIGFGGSIGRKSLIECLHEVSESCIYATDQELFELAPVAPITISS